MYFKKDRQLREPFTIKTVLPYIYLIPVCGWFLSIARNIVPTTDAMYVVYTNKKNNNLAQTRYLYNSDKILYKTVKLEW